MNDFSSGAVFLQNRNKLRPLKEFDPDNMAVRILDSFKFVIELVVLVGILKKDEELLQ